MANFFSKLNLGMKKTRDNFSGNIDNVLNAFEEIGDDLYDELTEVLVMSDVGVYTAETIIEELKDRVSKQGAKNTAEVKQLIKDVVADMLGEDETIDFVTTPAVILVIGVNGVGKTTTIGKMANYFKSQGKTVILGAADTFRAAAIDQLEIWAERAGVDLVKHGEGADPAAVVFDTINAGINRNADVIICDTAGRIHNKKNLMAELGKIYKVIDRELPYSDREIFLVLDATTGQNAISQAKEFMNVAEVSGIVLTKLDGTARGGVVLSIKNDLKLPVKFIGVGEGIDDLQPFKATAFAEGLFDTVDEEQQAALEELLEENMHMSDIETYRQQAAEARAKAEGADGEEAPAELTKKEEKEIRKAQEKARKEAEEKARREAEEKARRKEEKKAKEQARKEQRAAELAAAEEAQRREAEERAAEEAARKAAEEKAAEEAALREAAEEARRIAEEKAAKEAAAKAEAEAKAAAEKAEAEAKAAIEAKRAANPELQSEIETLEAEISKLRSELEAETGFVEKLRKEMDIDLLVAKLNNLKKSF